MKERPAETQNPPAVRDSKLKQPSVTRQELVVKPKQNTKSSRVAVNSGGNPQNPDGPSIGAAGRFRQGKSQAPDWPVHKSVAGSD